MNEETGKDKHKYNCKYQLSDVSVLAHAIQKKEKHGTSRKI